MGESVPEYFFEDELESEGEFLDGRRHGIWRFYYKKNGELESEGEFLHGHRHGIWRFYFGGENGTKYVCVAKYMDGYVIESRDFENKNTMPNNEKN